MPVQIPYRECCQACARGRGVQAPHRRVQEREGLPVIQLDYFYPLGREEIKGLSVVDSTTGYGVSTMLRYKGIQDATYLAEAGVALEFVLSACRLTRADGEHEST